MNMLKLLDQIAVGNFIDAENITNNEVDAILCLIENCLAGRPCVNGL